MSSQTSLFYLCMTVAVLATYFSRNLQRSRFGRAFIAIRDNDISAEVMGINVVKYKLLAFYVAGSIGGVAGAFWISNLAAISPEHFPWFWSLLLVGVILIGGVGSIHGTIFGAVLMVVVMEMLQLAVILFNFYIPIIT